LELATRILRFISLRLSDKEVGLHKSIILEGSNYLFFDGKEYQDINVRDIWRPTVVCSPGERIKALIKPSGNSELRIGFALLENADPLIFTGDYSVDINYKLKSTSHSVEHHFRVPINRENDDMEYNEHSLWLDFKVDLKEFKGNDIELSLWAEYQSDLNNRRVNKLVKTPAISWGAPIIVRNNVPVQTKKVLLLALETLTDPSFISETYGIPTDHLFNFLNDEEWVKFHRAYAQSDGTLGAAGCLFTGLTPLQHGLFDYGSPFYTRYSDSWNTELQTLAQLLKKRQFCTDSGALRAYSGYFGCGRGFDSHFPCYSLHELDCADFDWFCQVWDRVLRNDAFIFLHFDRMHKPYAKWNRRHNKVYSAEQLSGVHSELEKYVTQLAELDIGLARLFNYLKSIDQYDNTLIICTGDHGGAYAWRKRLAYDLYEDRMRVPLWAKKASWTDTLELDTEHPVNATIFPFHNILAQLNIPAPEYFRSLAQVQPEFSGVAILETATHPTKQDYILSITDDTHKYIRFMKVDWIKNTIMSTERELLQPYAYARADYGLDMDCSSEEPDKFQKMRELANKHIESSFEFRRRFPLNKGSSSLRG
jgi:hypothetical protein